jgi:Cu+-exporting ATPase
MTSKDQGARHAPSSGCCGGHAANGHDHIEHVQTGGEAPETHRVRDPVCGMSVNPHTTLHRATHAGHTQYFCSAGCKTKFETEPQRYLDSSQTKPTAPTPAGTIYTCPMHPQVR